nr:MAG TPA: hypothetical protein [Caudoviricetes sp.]
MNTIETIKKELLEKGFTYNESSKLWYYTYSDFEVLSFVMNEHTKVNGDKCVAISAITLNNYFENLTYFKICYTLYFDNINKFYDLLTLLNYKIY